MPPLFSRYIKNETNRLRTLPNLHVFRRCVPYLAYVCPRHCRRNHLQRYQVFTWLNQRKGFRNIFHSIYISYTMETEQPPLSKSEKYKIWRTQNEAVYKANQQKQNAKRKERNQLKRIERIKQTLAALQNLNHPH